MQLAQIPCLRSCRPQRSARLSCRATLHARWCFDTRYGCKQEATLLLQEWVRTVGRSAGLLPTCTRLSSGSVGVPESRLEMEVTFDSMADFEHFLTNIPFQEHKAWTQRVASMVVDGSPMWQIHRSIPLTASSAPDDASAVVITPSKPAPQQLVVTDQITTADMAAWEQLKRASSSSSPGASGSPVPSEKVEDSDTDQPVQRDWKGDPIKFNPGDKLPFKFL